MCCVPVLSDQGIPFILVVTDDLPNLQCCCGGLRGRRDHHCQPSYSSSCRIITNSSTSMLQAHTTCTHTALQSRCPIIPCVSTPFECHGSLKIVDTWCPWIRSPLVGSQLYLFRMGWRNLIDCKITSLGHWADEQTLWHAERKYRREVGTRFRFIFQPQIRECEASIRFAVASYSHHADLIKAETNSDFWK